MPVLGFWFLHVSWSVAIYLCYYRLICSQWETVVVVMYNYRYIFSAENVKAWSFDQDQDTDVRLESMAKNVSKRQDLRVLQSTSPNNISLSVLSYFRNNNFIITYFKVLKLLIKSLYYKILNVFTNCNYKVINKVLTNISIYFLLNKDSY